MDYIIRAHQLCKTFPVEPSSTTAYRLLRQIFTGELSLHEAFPALRDINLEIQKGEKIGLIGNNGAGKTTLLKTIAGLYKPNGGTLYVGGSVTLLAGLGIGMLEELNVCENIILYGVIYGVAREKMVKNLHEILAWADLQNFAEAKLRALSSGMKTRLAFSAARYIDRDIHLFDEVMSAGDKNFREKCEAVFEDYKHTSKTFIVATHSMSFVKAFCSKALWLHKGRQVAFGEVDTILSQYQETGAR
jgi:ABC-type polysaccharide/polyol phosphate transport system ATPase subunit